MFLFVLPIVQVVLFCTTIGRDPAHLHLAIVNDELKDYQSCDTFHAPPDQCNMSLLSCQYLHDLSNRTTYIQDTYTTLEDAKHAVRRGRAWGVIHFNSNYTSSLVERIDLGNEAPEDVVVRADIGINFDMSSTSIQSIQKPQYVKVNYRPGYRTPHGPGCDLHLFAFHQKSAEPLRLESSRCGRADRFQRPRLWQQRTSVYRFH